MVFLSWLKDEDHKVEYVKGMNEKSSHHMIRLFTDQNCPFP